MLVVGLVGAVVCPCCTPHIHAVTGWLVVVGAWFFCFFVFFGIRFLVFGATVSARMRWMFTHWRAGFVAHSHWFLVIVKLPADGCCCSGERRGGARGIFTKMAGRYLGAWIFSCERHSDDFGALMPLLSDCTGILSLRAI